MWQEGRGNGVLVGGLGVLVMVGGVRSSELLCQQLAETPGHRIFAAAQSQTVHLQTQDGLMRTNRFRGCTIRNRCHKMYCRGSTST